MTRRKIEKKLPSLEPNFKDILVCRNPAIRPYLEIFVAQPENISQEILGTLFGIFEITDASEDSSYIVNYLISIIKKEYFAQARRGAIESFEAALHKANLALSKLASRGNISWVGKLDAICGVIEKNNIHLSQTGTAKALLLRSKILTNISESDQKAEEPNPLKTFEDVLSGRLENEDKLIITTESIFNIFSFEEIKRSALKFQPEEFMRFLNTALVNELERAAVLVIDISLKKELETVFAAPRKSNLNAFSQEAFAKNIPQRDSEKILENREEMILELREELQKTQEGFVDKKTGHIYIKDEKYDSDSEKKSAFASSLANLREIIILHLGRFFGLVKNIFKRLSSLISSVTLSKFKKTQKEQPHAADQLYAQEKASEKQPSPPFLKLTGEKISLAAKKTAAFFRVTWKIIIFIAQKIRPSFSKIGRIFSGFSRKQKIYAGVAVLAIIIIPYYIVKFQNGSQKKEPAPAPETVPAALPLEQDKNVARIQNLNDVFQGENILSVVNINGRNFAISKNEIISLEDKKSYALPDDFKNADLISQMDDLNFIFVIKNQKIVSFSATAGKFQDNNITFADGAAIASARSYLTYLYLLDTKNNQIYRYPRAEGGFGNKTDWLKDKADLAGIKDMAVNDNIYITDGKRILKFFRGKKQDYSIEDSATPIIPDKIYTKSTGENLYILDKNNSRVVKLDNTGKIVSQYYNSDLGSAKDFTVDEEIGVVYISSDTDVKSFNMNI